MKEYGNELNILEPHLETKGKDHSFLSPTFSDIVERTILNYIKEYGEGL